jgi:Fe-S-cluster containining protein
MNDNWVAEPSIALCATECGAKCCKNGFLYLLDVEMRRLKSLGKVKVLRAAKYWVLDFKTNGGQCPFLGGDNACTIYDQRPFACQMFPKKPYEDCLVWPKVAEDA